MAKIGQIILTIGAAMLAAGFVLPWFVGSAIPPVGYDILQIGGLVAAVVGAIVRAIGRRSASRAGG